MAAASRASLLMEVCNLEVEEKLPTGHAFVGRKVCVYLRSADMETSWRTCRSGYVRNP